MSAYLVDRSKKHLSHFSGYPYIVTRLVPALHHIALLPKSVGLKAWFEIGIKQVRANKLPTCLILNSERCVYFYVDGSAVISADIPTDSLIAVNRLKLFKEYAESDEILLRKIKLLEYQEKINGQDSKYVAGDLQKGGRKATFEELVRLEGEQVNGVPIGLAQCNVCNEWAGECVDPSPQFKGMLMRVFCSCGNDNLCARCDNTLYQKKLNANYYSELDNSIWHVPGFCGLDHHCDKA